MIKDWERARKEAKSKKAAAKQEQQKKINQKQDKNLKNLEKQGSLKKGHKVDRVLTIKKVTHNINGSAAGYSSSIGAVTSVLMCKVAWMKVVKENAAPGEPPVEPEPSLVPLTIMRQ